MDDTFLCSLFPSDVAEMREKPIQLIHEHEEPDKTFQVYELRNLCNSIVHLSHFIVEANEAQRGEESHLGSHSKPGQELKSSDSPSPAHLKSTLYLFLWLLDQR